ncbi:MAG TPA: arginine deiminase family protein [Thermoanaerobaculia bacterium]|nr:arginine deiminase family protein [Thermoanaerobaculia bacterium]
MRLNVTSEIGRLRRVLVHAPGPEIDRMTPAMMERLLFDDILYGEDARAEHEMFRQVLERGDVEVLDAADLLVETLAEGDARRFVLNELADAYGVPLKVVARLSEFSPEDLAYALVAGLRGDDPRRFELDPMPNYFFQRDPQFILGDRVIVSAMATDAREREALLARTIFDHCPRFAADRGPLFEIDAPPTAAADPSRAFPYPTLEGGDVLVPSPEVILIGISERTNRGGVEELAEYLRREETGFRHLILAELPRRRAYMHLDTVFTVIDEGLCLAYEPVVEPAGRGQVPHSPYVYHVDLQAPQVSFDVRPSLRRALAAVGLDYELVPCGGSDPLDQDREQWTDGANAFAVAPGVILLYRRNHCTLEELARRGWRVVEESDVADGTEPLLGEGRTVVALGGNELSRARGGPRCMTMPLVRDDL